MERHTRPWLGVALLAGVVYFLIGWLTTFPGNQRFWRPAAWALSALVYTAHIWYEHFRRRGAGLSTSWHAALAVAIGGFVLAVAGPLRSHGVHLNTLLALIVFPGVTAIPAFLVALAATAVLARLSHRQIC